MYLLAAFAAVVASALAGAPTSKPYVAPTYAPSYPKPLSGYPQPTPAAYVTPSPYVPAPAYGKPTATYQQPAPAYNAQPQYPSNTAPQYPSNPAPQYPSNPGPYNPTNYGGSTGNQYGGNTYNVNYDQRNNYAVHADNELDEVDKLFAQLDAGFQTANELFTDVQSQLALDERNVDELELIIIPALNLVSEQQNKQLDRLEYDLQELKDELIKMNDLITAVENQNAKNTKDQEKLNSLVTAAESLSILQSGLIAALLKAVENFKSTSLIFLKNEFAIFTTGVEQQGGLLASVSGLRASKLCESGVVTLNSVDLRATVNLQTNFGENNPNVLFGIVGYEFDTNVRKNKHPVSYSNTAYTKPGAYGNYGNYGNTGSYGNTRNYGNAGSYSNTGNYGSYGNTGNSANAGSYGGNYHIFQGPNDLGVFVRVNTSPHSLTFTAFDDSFADTALKSVTVSWQACSIGPGYEAVSH